MLISFEETERLQRELDEAKAELSKYRAEVTRPAHPIGPSHRGEAMSECHDENHGQYEIERMDECPLCVLAERDRLKAEVKKYFDAASQMTKDAEYYSKEEGDAAADAWNELYDLIYHAAKSAPEGE